jgi:hypothetical protein
VLVGVIDRNSVEVFVVVGFTVGLFEGLLIGELVGIYEGLLLVEFVGFVLGNVDGG